VCNAGEKGRESGHGRPPRSTTASALLVPLDVSRADTSTAANVFPPTAIIWRWFLVSLNMSWISPAGMIASEMLSAIRMSDGTLAAGGYYSCSSSKSGSQLPEAIRGGPREIDVNRLPVDPPHQLHRPLRRQMLPRQPLRNALPYFGG
jgi:hypothetical protein